MRKLGENTVIQQSKEIFNRFPGKLLRRSSALPGRKVLFQIGETFQKGEVVGPLPRDQLFVTFVPTNFKIQADHDETRVGTAAICFALSVHTIALVRSANT